MHVLKFKNLIINVLKCSNMSLLLQTILKTESCQILVRTNDYFIETPIIATIRMLKEKILEVSL